MRVRDPDLAKRIRSSLRAENDTTKSKLEIIFTGNGAQDILIYYFQYSQESFLFKILQTATFPEFSALKATTINLQSSIYPQLRNVTRRMTTLI